MKNKFYVLLAIDGAGKSILLDNIKKIKGWSLASYDNQYVPQKYEMIACIDNKIENHTLAYFPKLSKDFKSSLYSTYIYYLNDMVIQLRKQSHVICNSYYYKIIAKNILFDGEQSYFHNQWRMLPKPDKVILLNTDPEIAWSRISNPNSLFWNEYYGDKPTQKGYIQFQQDLNTTFVRELEGIDVVKIDGNQNKEKVLESFLTIIED